MITTRFYHQFQIKWEGNDAASYDFIVGGFSRTALQLVTRTLETDTAGSNT